jgi:hypothetical protein
LERQARHGEIEFLSCERQALLVSENASGLGHRGHPQDRVGATAPAQDVRSGGRGRSHIERQRKRPQHGGQPLLQVLHHAGKEKIRITVAQGAFEAAADKRAVEDDGSAHQAPDMA